MRRSPLAMSPFSPAQSRPAPAWIATAAHRSTAWNSARMRAWTSWGRGGRGRGSESPGMAPPSGKGRDGRPQHVPAASLLHLPGDAQADQRVDDVLAVVPAGQRLDDRGLAAGYAIAEQP